MSKGKVTSIWFTNEELTEIQEEMQKLNLTGVSQYIKFLHRKQRKKVKK